MNCFCWNDLFRSLLILLSCGILPVRADGTADSLFDGRTLSGWESRSGEQKWWRVEGGKIIGGSLTETVPNNTFLATTKRFQNFDLKLRIRIQGAGGFINSGIQIRSIRSPEGSEMIGYQVDAGEGWWGKLYDESRRNKVIAEPKDPAAVNAAIRAGDWNEYRIRTEGRRIQSWVNGVAALDYLESDPAIPLDGQIGIQVHSGGKALVEVEAIEIQELPSTPGAPTWNQSKIGPASSFIPPGGVRTPEQELDGFHVPEDFQVELVASETSSYGKFITAVFDSAGRLWTMTALEYPIDGNENPQASERVFANGGRDQVLVIDHPFSNPPSAPRVFIDGLVIPLGILPYQNGAYVQYGSEIRYYSDTDRDGHADQFETILTGFGTQDSHLFPHQFTRLPGGEILFAQGLFNSSTVRRGNGKPFISGEKSIQFNYCKTATFSLSGDCFEVTTAGLNNIWGLSISRTGEIWMQEANDIGHPVTPYYAGSHYPSGSSEKLRSYQPTMPATLSPPQMGGTGLSGLALADDRDGWATPWGLHGASADEPLHFYLANPITSRIQHVTATRTSDDFYHFEKQADLLISDDPNFRPVSLQFGPDGCLYFVDWYNKIISHNEVPRNHPERDKTHGRIWRIRHRGQSSKPIPQLSKLSSPALLEYLGADNNRLADLAWQELVDRKATSEIPELHRLILDSQSSVDRRLGALWALEGIDAVPVTTLINLANSNIGPLQRESIRIAAKHFTNKAEFLAVAEPLLTSPHHDVRLALGDSLRRVLDVGPKVVALMLRYAGERNDSPGFAGYCRTQERCLARWAMEQHPEQVISFLQTAEGRSFPVESRIVALLALGGRSGAVGLAGALAEVNRSLNDEEVRLLAAHFEERQVHQTLQTLLKNSRTSRAILTALKRLRTEISTQQLLPEIATAILKLWDQTSDPNDQAFLLEIAADFRVQEMDQRAVELAAAPETPQLLRIKALRTLQELGTHQVMPLNVLIGEASTDIPLQDEALSALAASPAPEAFGLLISHFPDLSFIRRNRLIERLAANLRTARQLVDAVENGDIDETDLSLSTLESLRDLLPENEEVRRLWQQICQQTQQVLQLRGGDKDFPVQSIHLEGPFTVETWLRLAPGISNRDGILSKPGLADWNFAYEVPRFWIQGRDIVVATTKSTPEIWTHYALTCDEQGIFRIYINGECNATSSESFSGSLDGLQIGRTTPRDQGTAGEFLEYRIWNVARSSEEIRETFDQQLSGQDRHPGLVQIFSGDQWGELSGTARVIPILDGPKLLDSQQAQHQAEKFARFRLLAQQPGDLLRGRVLFQEKCLVCHVQGGQGGRIGPALDGTGHRGIEAILRNVLTPSAAMEAGYRSFRVLTKDGRIFNGLLVSRNEEGVVLRVPNTPDQKISTSNIDRAEFTSLSVMPDGLLETMTPEQVSDILTYLMSLK